MYGDGAIHEGVFYFGCGNKAIHAIDIHRGEVLWSFEVRESAHQR